MLPRVPSETNPEDSRASGFPSAFSGFLKRSKKSAP